MKEWPIQKTIRYMKYLMVCILNVKYLFISHFNELKEILIFLKSYNHMELN